MNWPGFQTPGPPGASGLRARGSNPKRIASHPSQPRSYSGSCLGVWLLTHLPYRAAAQCRHQSFLVAPSTRRCSWLCPPPTLTNEPSRPACHVAMPEGSERRWAELNPLWAIAGCSLRLIVDWTSGRSAASLLAHCTRARFSSRSRKHTSLAMGRAVCSGHFEA